MKTEIEQMDSSKLNQEFDTIVKNYLSQKLKP